jgi:hypothetical protein
MMPRAPASSSFRTVDPLVEGIDRALTPSVENETMTESPMCSVVSVPPEVRTSRLYPVAPAETLQFAVKAFAPMPVAGVAVGGAGRDRAEVVTVIVEELPLVPFRL